MGLFDFFKRKKKTETENKRNSNLLLAMPIFSNGGQYTLNHVIDHLKTFWQVDIKDLSGNDESAVFFVNNQMIALMNMPMPIPEGDLNTTIPYAYVWKSAAEDLKKQTGHAIVSVSGVGSVVERYTILSQIICSIMLTTLDCIGLYQGSQRLLLQREHYLTAAEDLKHSRLPIPAWIYIGLVNSEGQSNAYTYGMQVFGKSEVEIVGSIFNLTHLYKLMLSITSHIIENDAELKDGDTYTITDGIELKVSFSAGIYVNGKTLKLEV